MILIQKMDCRICVSFLLHHHRFLQSKQPKTTPILSSYFCRSEVWVGSTCFLSRPSQACSPPGVLGFCLQGLEMEWVPGSFTLLAAISSVQLETEVLVSFWLLTRDRPYWFSSLHMVLSILKAATARKSFCMIWISLTSLITQFHSQSHISGVC